MKIYEAITEKILLYLYLLLLILLLITNKKNVKYSLKRLILSLFLFLKFIDYFMKQ